MPYKTIKEVTALTGATESALRYYDEKDLLRPTIKNRTGRKEWLYDDTALEKLRLVIMYKNMGLSIEDIGMMLEGKEKERTKILAAHLAKLEEKRSGLENQIAAVKLLRMIEDIAEGDEEQSGRLLEKLLDETVQLFNDERNEEWRNEK